jgi:hypothetical protein
VRCERCHISAQGMAGGLKTCQVTTREDTKQQQQQHSKSTQHGVQHGQLPVSHFLAAKTVAGSQWLCQSL